MNGSNESYIISNHTHQHEYQNQYYSRKNRQEDMITIIIFFGLMLFCFISLNRDLNQCLREACYEMYKTYCMPCIILKNKFCPIKEKIYVTHIEKQLNQNSKVLDSCLVELYKDIECSICLDKIISEEDNEIIVLKCNHVFHKKCLSNWLRIENSLDDESDLNVCPLCRNEVEIENLFKMGR
ncbi:Ring finger domain [seawater metagenome]|uniref:Ring finger domain n=1 Tax=seawater metagenome TaxID=1561972 RepID=A0A5E8CJM9_9ZZZZ